MHRFFSRRRRRRAKVPATPTQKRDARSLLLPRLEYFAQRYGFVYNKVAFRNQHTRWGSCSTKQNLNFNVRLVQLPEQLRDYVIVHELCHTRHMNHSRAFWSEVEHILPHYRELRRTMRKIHITPSGALKVVERPMRPPLKGQQQRRIIRVYTYE